MIQKTKELADKTAPFVQKAKSYGSSAVAYIGKQIETTPIFIKNEEEFNMHIHAKRAILIAYDGREEMSEYVRLMMPVWATQAWSDAAELKYLEISTYPDLAKTLNIVGPIEMRVIYSGEESVRHSTLQAIKDWWKTCNYLPPDSSRSPIGDNGTP